MAVGKVIRGGLKTCSKELADQYYKILNIQWDCEKEKIIAHNIKDRGRADSGFQGDNHFRNLTELKSQINNCQNDSNKDKNS